MPGEPQPAADQQHAADRGDRAEPAWQAERHEVERAGEQRAAGDETPCRAARIELPRHQRGDGVNQLIMATGLEPYRGVAMRGMRAERAGGHRERAGQRGEARHQEHPQSLSRTSAESTDSATPLSSSVMILPIAARSSPVSNWARRRSISRLR